MDATSTTPSRSRRLWAEWCERTTFHGFQDLGSDSARLVAFWVLAIAAAASATAFGISRIFLDYFETPTVIRIERLEEPLMRLPDVVVCSPAGLNVTALRAGGASETLVDALLLAVSDPTVFVTRYATDRRSQLEQWRRELRAFEARNNISSRHFEFLWRYRIRCEEFVIGCLTFDDQSTLRDCCRGAEYIQDRQYFGCYRLKGLGDQTWTGNTAGASLVLKTSFPEFGNSVANLRRGIAIQVVPVGLPYDYYKMNIPSGVVASIGLLWQEIQMRYNFKQPCWDQDGQDVVQRQQTTDAFCFSNHWNNAFLDHCGCNALTFPNKTGVDNCDLLDYLECFLLNRTNFRHIMDKSNAKRGHCWPECSQIGFNPLLTMLTLDASVLSTLIHSDRRFNVIGGKSMHPNAVSIVEIYYRSLRKIVYREFDLYSPDTFISNIGGQIGLWCGCSILSVVQAVLYCIRCLRPHKTTSRVSPRVVDVPVGPKTAQSNSWESKL